MKRFALLMALIMCVSIAGAVAAETPAGTTGQAMYDGNTRVIRIASHFDWGDIYTDGQAVDALSGYLTNPESFEARYANQKAVEEKYNVKFEFERMTFEGLPISMDEGVLSGKPEADIYMMDIQQAMNYALNDYLYALEDLTGPEDGVFTTQQVFKGLKFPGQDKTYLWSFYREESDPYVLGFNWTLLQSKGLENPQDLWDRGEWTWDVFLDYCEKTTDLTSSVPTYGFIGLWTNHLDGFLRSNGAQIAGTPEGGLMTAATGQVLDMFKKLYVDLKVAKPWNPDSWNVNNHYCDGTAAFFTAANWILNDSGPDYGGGMSNPLNFEIGVVPYPVGPSGNQETNAQHSVSGNYLLIPKGIEDPSLVYHAFYALRDWYGDDFANTKKYDVLDPNEVPMTWSEQVVTAAAHGNEELAANNVRLYDMAMQRVSFDPWGSLKISAGDSGGFSMMPIMNGTMTPAQFQETFKQPLADALKTLYK